MLGKVKQLLLNKRNYLFSFFIPLVLLTILFAFLQITPFGENNLMVSDLGSQYVTFFSYLKGIFLGNASPFYSFVQSLGDNFLPLAAYYLMSPFNFLVIFSKAENMDVFISILLMLKVGAISTSMYFYLSHRFFKQKNAMIAFSIAYAFCAFVGVYAINIMWLDGLILFPIVVYHLEKFIETKNGLKYTFSLALAIVVNYYLGYMICLFAVLLFINNTVLRKETSSLKQYYLENKALILAFLRYSLLGGMMSAFILLPAALGMMKTGKSVFHWIDFVPKIHFSLDFLTQLGMENTTFSSRLAHLPTIYVGAFVLLLTFLYFFDKSFSRKEKVVRLVFLGSVFLSFMVQPFNLFWQMFQKTAGFPFRNAFMFSFLMLVTAVEVWERREKLEKRAVVKSALLVSVLLIIGYLWTILGKGRLIVLAENDSVLSLKIFLLSLVFLFTTVLLLLQGRFNKKILLLCLVLDVSINFLNMFGSIPFGNTARYFENEQKQANAVSKLKETVSEKNQFYRLENDMTKLDNGYNQSLMNNYYAVPSYSSTLNEQLRETLSFLGLYSKNERRISDTGLTSFTRYLLSINYTILDNEKIKMNYNEKSSIGYVVPKEVAPLLLTEGQPFENQTALARAILGKKDFLLFERPIVKGINADTVQVTPKNKGHLYLYLPFVDGRVLQDVFINGKAVKPKITIEKKRALLDLGEKNIGETFQLTVNEIESEGDITENLFLLPDTKLDLVKQKLTANLLDVKFDNKKTVFKGIVNAKEEEVLFTSIPYSSYWKMQVDGKEVRPIPVMNHTFLGAKLSKGSHQIRIYYVPYDFYIGLAIALFSGLVLFEVEYLRHIKKKKKEQLLLHINEKNFLKE